MLHDGEAARCIQKMKNANALGMHVIHVISGESWGHLTALVDVMDMFP